jgi:hypothetical protein
MNMEQFERRIDRGNRCTLRIPAPVPHFPPQIPHHLTVRVSVLGMTERRRWLSHSGSNPRRQTSTTQEFKRWSHDMTTVSIPMANMLKNSWTLAVSVAINISMKLCFVSVNGPRETYFVDEPRTRVEIYWSAECGVNIFSKPVPYDFAWS